MPTVDEWADQIAAQYHKTKGTPAPAPSGTSDLDAWADQAAAKYRAGKEGIATPGAWRAFQPKAGVNLGDLHPEAQPIARGLDEFLAERGHKAIVTSGRQTRAQKSYHTEGQALDFVVPGADMAALAEELKRQGYAAQFERKDQVNANKSVATGDHVHVSLLRRPVAFALPVRETPAPSQPRLEVSVPPPPVRVAPKKRGMQAPPLADLTKWAEETPKPKVPQPAAFSGGVLQRLYTDVFRPAFETFNVAPETYAAGERMAQLREQFQQSGAAKPLPPLSRDRVERARQIAARDELLNYMGSVANSVGGLDPWLHLKRNPKEALDRLEGVMRRPLNPWERKLFPSLLQNRALESGLERIRAKGFTQDIITNVAGELIGGAVGKKFLASALAQKVPSVAGRAIGTTLAGGTASSAISGATVTGQELAKGTPLPQALKKGAQSMPPAFLAGSIGGALHIPSLAKAGVSAAAGKLAKVRPTHPGPAAVLSDGQTLHLRAAAPEQLQALAQSGEPSAPAAQQWLARHAEYQNARDRIRPLPDTEADAYTAAWKKADNPIRRHSSVLDFAANEEGRKFNSATRGLLADAAGQIKEHFADEYRSATFGDPLPDVGPPFVSPWRKIAPDQRAILKPDERAALLYLDTLNSRQVLGPGVSYAHVAVRFKPDEKAADALFNQAQEKLSGEVIEQAPVEAPTVPVAARVADERPIGLPEGEAAPVAVPDAIDAGVARLQEEAAAAAVPTGPEGVERRETPVLRKRIDQMTPEEKDLFIQTLQEEGLKNPVTGLPNRLAYKHTPKKAFQAEVDADSLKWWNDEFAPEAGDDGGDALLRAVGDALRMTGLDAYHIGGDEFVVQGDAQVPLFEALTRASELLKNAVISFETMDGRIRTFRGAEMTFGIGRTVKGEKPYVEANANLKIKKAAREKAGVRAGRGERPPGVVEIGAEARKPEGKPKLEGDVPRTGKRADEGVAAEAAPKPAAPKAAKSEGAATSFKAGDQSVKGRWAIYDVDDLVTSHDDALNPNKAFPQELQPRDRGRQIGKDQVAELAQKLDPQLMGENPLAQHGAPIVGPDSVVESGNGRTIALRQLYARRGGQNYRDWLAENASKFGVDPASLNGVKNPILVRVRTDKMSAAERVEFTRAANARETAAMGAVEQAKVDADRITPGMFRMLDLGESGEITSASNRGFVRDFLANVPTSEQGLLRTAEGGISQDGIRRIRNAIFYRTYGNIDALARMAETLDDPARNITNGMLRAAGPMMDLQRRIDEGSAYPIGIGEDVAIAASKIAALREQNMPIGEYLAQGSLYGGDLTDLQQNILVQLDRLKRSPKQIAAVLTDYADLGVKAGDPSTGRLFDDIAPPEKETLWKAAVSRTQRIANDEPGLFAEAETGARTETQRREPGESIQAPVVAATRATPEKATRQPAKAAGVTKPAAKPKRAAAPKAEAAPAKAEPKPAAKPKKAAAPAKSARDRIAEKASAAAEWEAMSGAQRRAHAAGMPRDEFVQRYSIEGLSRGPEEPLGEQLKHIADTGKPGFGVEKRLGGGSSLAVVFRDKSGNKRAALEFSVGEDGKPAGIMNLFVDPPLRRKGLATRLYEEAAKAGYDVSEVSGSFLSEAAAALFHKRATEPKPAAKPKKAAAPKAKPEPGVVDPAALQKLQQKEASAAEALKKAGLQFLMEKSWLDANHILYGYSETKRKLYDRWVDARNAAMGYEKRGYEPPIDEVAPPAPKPKKYVKHNGTAIRSDIPASMQGVKVKKGEVPESGRKGGVSEGERIARNARDVTAASTGKPLSVLGFRYGNPATHISGSGLFYAINPRLARDYGVMRGLVEPGVPEAEARKRLVIQEIRLDNPLVIDGGQTALWKSVGALPFSDRAKDAIREAGQMLSRGMVKDYGEFDRAVRLAALEAGFDGIVYRRPTTDGQNQTHIAVLAEDAVPESGRKGGEASSPGVPPRPKPIKDLPDDLTSSKNMRDLYVRNYGSDKAPVTPYLEEKGLSFRELAHSLTREFSDLPQGGKFEGFRHAIRNIIRSGSLAIQEADATLKDTFKHLNGVQRHKLGFALEAYDMKEDWDIQKADREEKITLRLAATEGKARYFLRRLQKMAADREGKLADLERELRELPDAASEETANKLEAEKKNLTVRQARADKQEAAAIARINKSAALHEAKLVELERKLSESRDDPPEARARWEGEKRARARRLEELQRQLQSTADRAAKVRDARAEKAGSIDKQLADLGDYPKSLEKRAELTKKIASVDKELKQAAGRAERIERGLKKRQSAASEAFTALKDEDLPIFNDEQNPLTPDDLRQALKDSDRHLAQDAALRKAREARQKYMDDLVAETKAIHKELFGFEPALNRKNYVHHAVLEYAMGKGSGAGASRKIARPKSGHLNHRSGTTLAYNRNFFEAEAKVLTAMHRDLITLRALSEIKKHDIGDRLRAEYIAARKTDKKAKIAIPEGYAGFDPNTSRITERFQPPDERMLRRLEDEHMQGLGISEGQAKQDLAFGRQTWYVPVEMANTLKKLGAYGREPIIKKLVPGFNKAFKWNILKNPLFFGRYELNNHAGDTFSAYKFTPIRRWANITKIATGHAFQQVWGNALNLPGHKDAPGFRQWKKRAGVGHGQLAQELKGSGIEVGQVRNWQQYVMSEPNPAKRLLLAAWSPAYYAGGYWGQFANWFDNARESLWSYTLTLDAYQDMMRNGGEPSDFGASIPDEVMAHDDPWDRAYMIGREKLIDYSKTTEAGRIIADGVWPFYRYTEGNHKREVRYGMNQFRNIDQAATLGQKVALKFGRGAKIGAIGAARLGWFAAKLVAAQSLLDLWNSRYPQEVVAAAEEQEEGRPYLIAGYDPVTGNVKLVRNLGSVPEFLAIFSIHDMYRIGAGWANGQYSMGDALRKAAERQGRNVRQGLSPLIETGQILTGTYNVKGKSLPVRDMGDALIGRLAGWPAQRLYRAWRGIPQAPVEWEKTAIGNFKVRQVAYQMIAQSRDLFEQKVEKKRPASGGYTEKANALYWHRMAAKHGDEMLAQQYWNDYVELTGPKDAVEGFTRSADAMSPIRGMSTNGLLLKEWWSRLEGVERKMLPLAMQHWAELVAPGYTVKPKYTSPYQLIVEHNLIVGKAKIHASQMMSKYSTPEARREGMRKTLLKKGVGEIPE